ncbi:MAG: protein kinase, partial [Planctomycetota bacterium]
MPDPHSDELFQEPTFRELVKNAKNIGASLISNGVNIDASLVNIQLDKFRLLEMRGHGGFGVVYRAFDETLSREVALKIPKFAALISSGDRDRFRQEAEITAQLDHPSIVKVFEAQLQGELPFICSEYCHGPDLRDWLCQRNEPVPAKQACRFLIKLSEALHYAHQRGIFHRDLKPANILLEPVSIEDPAIHDCELKNFYPRLTDFGIAKLTTSARHIHSTTSLIVGTPQYLSPEQFLSKPSDQREFALSDQFSLGIILLELLTLKVPFDGATIVEWVRFIDSYDPIELPVDWPDQKLAAICRKAISRVPQDRYHDIEEFKHELENYIANKPIATSFRNPRAERLFTWARNPNRLRQAGLTAILFHLFVSVWIFVVFFGAFDLLSRTQMISSFFSDFAFVFTTMHFPVIVVGYFVSRLRLWAFVPSFLLSLLITGVFIFSAFGSDVVFGYLYEQPFAHASQVQRLGGSVPGNARRRSR